MYDEAFEMVLQFQEPNFAPVPQCSASVPQPKGVIYAIHPSRHEHRWCQKSEQFANAVHF